MTVYTSSSLPASVIWLNPIEPIWQTLQTYSPTSPNWKRQYLGLSDRLFIGAVINAPKNNASGAS